MKLPANLPSRSAVPLSLAAAALLLLLGLGYAIHHRRVLRAETEARLSGDLASAHSRFPLGSSLGDVQRALPADTTFLANHPGDWDSSPSDLLLLDLLEHDPSPVWYCTYNNAYLIFVFSPRTPAAARLQNIRLGHRLADCL